MLLFKGSHIITHFKANKFCTAQENELGVLCTIYKLAGLSVFVCFLCFLKIKVNKPNLLLYTLMAKSVSST